jgi:hypothetical protein
VHSYVFESAVNLLICAAKKSNRSACGPSFPNRFCGPENEWICLQALCPSVPIYAKVYRCKSTFHASPPLILARLDEASFRNPMSHVLHRQVSLRFRGRFLFILRTVAPVHTPEGNLDSADGTSLPSANIICQTMQPNKAINPFTPLSSEYHVADRFSVQQ